MLDDPKGPLREAELTQLKERGKKELANSKLMYFLTWSRRKTFHCLRWKQPVPTTSGMFQEEDRNLWWLEAILGSLQGQHKERNRGAAEESHHFQCTPNHQRKSLSFSRLLYTYKDMHIGSLTIIVVPALGWALYLAKQRQAVSMTESILRCCYKHNPTQPSPAAEPS